ncbi:MAG TPA: tail fiber domain-containing protein [Polyangiaceae bacterium]|nr:tail fiber domain-containing protein [Polyangiaceae bacterium]
MKRSIALTSFAFSIFGTACGGFTEIGEGTAGSDSGGATAQGGKSPGGSPGTGGARFTGGASGLGGAAAGGTTADGGSAGIGNASSTGGSAGSVGQPCTTSEECPQIKAPCRLCEDGSEACPWSRCENGVCLAGIDQCPTPNPCAGKKCGDICTTCSPGQTCPPIVEYCDSKQQCQRDQPNCGGSCSATGESCANGETCCDGLECCVGVPVPQGSEFCGTVCPKSDQNIKRNFLSVDPDQVLDKLSRLPVGTWSYRTESSTERHIGPMAQDFMAAFHVGSSDRTILQVDADGVAFAAIQALNARLKSLEERNQKLERDLAEQRSRCER